MTNALNLLGKSDLFRDMSTNNQLGTLLKELSGGSISTSDAAGKLAGIIAGANKGGTDNSKQNTNVNTDKSGEKSLPKLPPPIIDTVDQIENSKLTPEQKATAKQKFADSLGIDYFNPNSQDIDLGLTNASLVDRALDKIENIVDTQGNVTVTTDRGSFPPAKSIERVNTVPNAPLKWVWFYRFFSPSIIGEDDDAIIKLEGNFGYNTVNGILDQTQPLLVNVQFNLDNHTGFSKFGSYLNFRAQLNDTRVGSEKHPTFQFRIVAEFNPVGIGSCTIKSLLEVDNTGHVEIIGGTKIESGNATIDEDLLGTRISIYVIT